MKHPELLLHHPLFNNMNTTEIEQILSCFSFIERKYSKDDYIVLEGDTISNIGIILHGIVLMEKNDLYGNNYFITQLREYEIFAEPFISNNLLNSTVNYKAMTNCQILLFQYRDLWVPCDKNCRCHRIFTENLMNLLAIKTRSLLSKIDIISKKSIRDRILTFLYVMKENQNLSNNKNMAYSEYVSVKHATILNHFLNNEEIFIPFNHTEMAEYLCVNRSALVRELSKMKAEGLLTYKGNVFKLQKESVSQNTLPRDL